MTGNRCDHNPRALRLCDIVRRGRGGHPQILGVISAYLNHAAKNRAKLPALADLNSSGRRKRTERYEVILAVCQFLTARWLQPDTRRCVMPNEKFLEVPDAAHIAGEVSRSPAWHGKAKLSTQRVYDALTDLVAAGYVRRSKQVREVLDSGEWVARPKILVFTKRFFQHLGGQRLWSSIRAKGKRLIQDLRTHLVKRLGDPGKARAALARYLKPGKLLSPRQAFAWVKANGSRPPTPHIELQRATLLQQNTDELSAL